jgi:hypothetical protein
VRSLSRKELGTADEQERMNIFRRYFAASRYSRLLIQQALVRSAIDESLKSKVKKLERDHNKDFALVVSEIKKSDYFQEFLVAAQEEDDALQNIIEAYDKRMNREK